MTDPNPHAAVFHHSPEGVTYKASCEVEDCDFITYVGASTDIAYSAWFYRQHRIQYEPGHAPDIEVSWAVLADCSVCEDGGGVEQVDEGLSCTDCGTYWNMTGEYGETVDHP